MASIMTQSVRESSREESISMDLVSLPLKPSPKYRVSEVIEASALNCEDETRLACG